MIVLYTSILGKCEKIKYHIYIEFNSDFPIGNTIINKRADAHIRYLVGVFISDAN